MNIKCAPALVLLAILCATETNASSCDEPAARQFDFWLGSWNVQNRQANPGNPTDPGLYPTGNAVAHVDSVADGCAIVEEWAGDLSWGRVLGFSLRTYDRETEQWRLLLNWPAAGSGTPAGFSEHQGVFRHGRGEFFSSITRPDDSVLISRFTFSDIKPNAYRWDGATSTDGGVYWRTNWVMEAMRQPAGTGDDAGQSNVHESNNQACAKTPGSATLDYLQGEWSGRTADDISVRLLVQPILEGCGAVEYLTISTEPAQQEFRVRAFQPDAGEWVLYAVSNTRNGLTRVTGMPINRELAWTTAEQGDVYESWNLDKAHRLLWSRTRSAGDTMNATLSSAP